MGAWGSRAAFTPLLLACYGITALLHLATVSLNTLLPFHVVDLGGTKTQIGLLFSISTIAAMLLRPTVGGWVDRFGARRVLLPGAVALGVTSLALHFAVSPVGLMALMIGVGVASGLISTSASVIAATHSDPAHRGEALGTYYLASSIAIAIGPPLAFGLRRLPVSGALVLATLGHSSVYGFLPLYAVSRGQGPALAVFFTVYPLCLIVCRALLRGAPDRFGHGRVAFAAMALSAVAYAVLALPPTMVSLALAAVLIGAGGAVMYPALAALVVNRAEASDRGLALGTLSGSWDLGVVVGSALVGIVADRIGFGAGFTVGALGSALGCAALLVATRRHALTPDAPWR